MFFIDKSIGFFILRIKYATEISPMENNTTDGNAFEKKDVKSQDVIYEPLNTNTTGEPFQAYTTHESFTKNLTSFLFSTGNGGITGWMTNIYRILHDISYYYMMEGLEEYDAKNLYYMRFDFLRGRLMPLFYQNMVSIAVFILLAFSFFPSMWFYAYLYIFLTAILFCAKQMLTKSVKNATKDDMEKIILKYQPIFAVLLILQTLTSVWVFIWFIVIGAILYVINYAREKEWIQQCCASFNKLKSK